MRRSLAMGLVLAACGGAKHEATVTETCAAENDGKDLEIVGTLTMPTMVGECATHCDVDLTDAGEYAGVHTIRVQIPIGTGPLTMAPLPKGKGLTTIYAQSLTVTASDGTAAPIGTRVRVAGRFTAKRTAVGSASILDCALVPTRLDPVAK